LACFQAWKQTGETAGSEIKIRMKPRGCITQNGVKNTFEEVPIEVCFTYFSHFMKVVFYTNLLNVFKQLFEIF
jgi:hypothetical protein